MNTSNHWAYTDKREEVINRVKKYLKPDYWKGKHRDVETMIKLHAHHKKSFSILLQEVRNNLPLFNLYDGAMVYTPLWDTDNGITYCAKCHDLTRMVYK